MSEATPTPPKENRKQNDYPTSDEREAAAAAARRVVNTNSAPTPNYAARRLTAALTGGALLFTSLGVAQALSNEGKQDARATSISEAYKHSESILHAIQTEAHANVDPASIVGLFNVKKGTTVNELSNDIVEAQPEYKDADEATKEWIDYTVLESGKAQGVYNVGDTFVVSQAEIDGRNTFIVQDGSGIQLPTTPANNDPTTIPAVETH